jgi:arginyl-tRNA synthetase
MNCLQKMQQSFNSFLTKQFGIDANLLRSCQLIINADQQRQQFGDLNSSAPLVLAKVLQQKPHEIGRIIATAFSDPLIKNIELAGPGFLNVFLTDGAYVEIAQELFESRASFFEPASGAYKGKVSIEFVSANPTGPLHFGHGRGGIIGDVLGNILTFLGYTVVKEFYINDAGSQVQKLATSLVIRCQQMLGIDAKLPEDAYHGEYLKALAQKCIAEYGPTVLERSEDFFQEYAKEHLLKNIKTTLDKYRIHFDVWFSEKTLHESGAIEGALDVLQKKQLIYSDDGALWFASTRFGDDKDRVVRKATGDWTYVAADIAYLKNKSDRGFQSVIMVLGHDHHSYAVRLQAIKTALELKLDLDVILYQLVKIKEAGQEVRMSKRAGKMINLEDIIDAVGVDVARFFYLHRKADAQLDFDIDLALKKTEENPVYYVQYAYVRIKSILQKASEVMPNSFSVTAQDALAITSQEYFLLKKIASLQELLEGIRENHQTHLLAHYVVDLANAFHHYYSSNRIVNPEQIKETRGRIVMILILKNTFGIILDMLGVSKPEKM